LNKVMLYILRGQQFETIFQQFAHSPLFACAVVGSERAFWPFLSLWGQVVSESRCLYLN